MDLDTKLSADCTSFLLMTWIELVASARSVPTCFTEMSLARMLANRFQRRFDNIEFERTIVCYTVIGFFHYSTLARP